MHIRNQINGTSGADFFSYLRLNNVDLFGNNGNDVFNLWFANSAFASGGMGNDRFFIRNGEGVTVDDRWGSNVLVATNTEDLTIRFGGGRDILRLDSVFDFSAKVGGGNDAVSIKNADGGKVWLEAGADVLKVINSSNISASGGTGTDTFDVRDSSQIRISDTSGDTKVTITDSNKVTVTFGRDWNDDQVTVTRGEGHLIRTGGGDDVVRVFNPDGSSRYELGDGNDALHLTFNFWGDQIDFLNAGTLVGGRGADTLYVEGFASDEAMVLVGLAWRDYNYGEGDRIVFYGDEPIVEGGDVLLYNTSNDGLFSMSVAGPGWQHPDGIGINTDWMFG